MKRLLASNAGVLLVQPLQTQWLDARGDLMGQPADASRPARLVLDLMEETHVHLEVPAMMGNDRKGFIQFHLQSKLPDVPLRGLWPSSSINAPFARAFSLHAIGIASERLNRLLDELVTDNRPLLGAWSLSYLMAHWAGRQRAVPKVGAVFLALSMPYGVRLVLLKNRVPVFSRLLLATDSATQADELIQTHKYLVDDRVLDRDVPPRFLLLDADPGLSTALFNLGASVLPESEAHARGTLAQLLALARDGAPGQVATVFHRRLHLAAKLRKVLLLLAGLLTMGLALTAYGEVQYLVDRLAQVSQWNQKTRELNQRTQAVRQAIEQTGADVALMRQAQAVEQSELGPPLMPEAVLWPMAQLMQAVPAAQLVDLAFGLSPTPCAAPQAPVPMARGMAPVAAGQPGVQWSFQLRPAPGLTPRARQAVLVDLGQRVAAWSDWRVVNDPVRPAGSAVMSNKEAGEANTWKWCLSAAAATQQPGRVQP